MKRNKLIEIALAVVCGLGATSAAAQADAAMTEEARKLAGQMIQTLGGRLQAEMKAGGPAAAIGICASAAPAIAGELSRLNGVRLTRVSLKVRNPLLGTPDAWEQVALNAFESRLAKGEAADKLEFAETVAEPSGRYFRYVKALPVQPVCLNCHGETTGLASEIKERLAREYPADRATGYTLGQIRGAVSIKRPL